MVGIVRCCIKKLFNDNVLRQTTAQCLGGEPLIMKLSSAVRLFANAPLAPISLDWLSPGLRRFYSFSALLQITKANGGNT